MGPHPELPLTDSTETPHRWLAGLIAAAAVITATGVAILATGPGATEQAVLSAPMGERAVEGGEPDLIPATSESPPAAQPQLDARWATWTVEPTAVPARSPLHIGRHYYLEADQGTMALSVMPEVEIRSPQIDAKIDGYAVTTTRIPGSTAVLHDVAIGTGTLRLRTVDVDDNRAHQVIAAAARSLGEHLDGALRLPDDVTVVGERTEDDPHPVTEASTAESGTGEGLRIARVRVDTPAQSRVLTVEVRLMGGRVINDDHLLVWFMPGMDDPEVGTIFWEEDGWRWSVNGVGPDSYAAVELIAAAPVLVAER
jgi:hypothetical protein